MAQQPFLDYKAADKPPQIYGFLFNLFLWKCEMNECVILGPNAFNVDPELQNFQKLPMNS